MKAGNKIFLGLSVGVHPLNVKENNSPDLSNVLVNENKAGLLTNMPGTEKYNSVGFGEAMVAIHQLNGTIFTLAGNTFWKGYPDITYSGVSSPVDVKVSIAGNLLIADSGNNQATTLSLQGGDPEHFGSLELSGIGGVVENASHDVCVTDIGGGRIILFDWGTWTVQATLGGFIQPAGISVDNFSPPFYYVTDKANNNITKTHIDGSNQTVLGGFDAPEAVYYCDGYLYVANTGGNNIIKTKIDGSSQTTLGGFNSPKGIYCNEVSGYLYVANTGADNIIKTKINADGWTVLAGFNAPESVWYHSDSGYIYVANTGNDEIVKTII
jgi:DNA-binding beta-propeller fold protein YncE